MSYDEILQAATELPEAQRAELIESLIQSLDVENAAPLDDAWLAEIDRRSRQIDAGEVELIPWEEVMRRARLRVGHSGE